MENYQKLEKIGEGSSKLLDISRGIDQYLEHETRIPY
jgi:hypothetical protein